MEQDILLHQNRLGTMRGDDGISVPRARDGGKNKKLNVSAGVWWHDRYRSGGPLPSYVTNYLSSLGNVSVCINFVLGLPLLALGTGIDVFAPSRTQKTRSHCFWQVAAFKMGDTQKPTTLGSGVFLMVSSQITLVGRHDRQQMCCSVIGSRGPKWSGLPY